jgi:hypothetical protein
VIFIIVVSIVFLLHDKFNNTRRHTQALAVITGPALLVTQTRNNDVRIRILTTKEIYQKLVSSKLWKKLFKDVLPDEGNFADMRLPKKVKENLANQGFKNIRDLDGALFIDELFALCNNKAQLFTEITTQMKIWDLSFKKPRVYRANTPLARLILNQTGAPYGYMIQYLLPDLIKAGIVTIKDAQTASASQLAPHFYRHKEIIQLRKLLTTLGFKQKKINLRSAKTELAEYILATYYPFENGDFSSLITVLNARNVRSIHDALIYTGNVSDHPHLNTLFRNIQSTLTNEGFRPAGKAQALIAKNVMTGDTVDPTKFKIAVENESFAVMLAMAVGTVLAASFVSGALWVVSNTIDYPFSPLVVISGLLATWALSVFVNWIIHKIFVSWHDEVVLRTSKDTYMTIKPTDFTTQWNSAPWQEVIRQIRNGSFKFNFLRGSLLMPLMGMAWTYFAVNLGDPTFMIPYYIYVWGGFVPTGISLFIMRFTYLFIKNGHTNFNNREVGPLAVIPSRNQLSDTLIETGPHGEQKTEKPNHYEKV